MLENIAKRDGTNVEKAKAYGVGKFFKGRMELIIDLMVGSRGNIGLGFLIGIILIIVIGWIPILGAFVAGLAGGWVARGSMRGLAVGFVSGIVGLVLITTVLTGLGAAIYGHIGEIVGGVVGVVLSAGSVFMASVGGLVGGLANHRGLPASTRIKRGKKR